MADDTGLKSSFELAMERLRQRDKEEGVEHRPLTDEQKAEIAEIRNRCEARIAELEVLHDSQRWSTADPAERAARDEEYRRERDRLTTDRDAKIEKIRSRS